jgi:PAS domain S-box-containing protein
MAENRPSNDGRPQPPTNGDRQPDATERYRALVENTSEGIWRLEFDPPVDTTLPVDAQVELAYRHGLLTECNDAMARMYGLERAGDLVGASLDAMLPSCDPAARAYIASIVEAGYRVSNVESTERDANGGIKHFANSMSGVVENGRLLRMWGTQRDITDRKREGEASAYLAAIVQSSDDAILSKDLDGIIRSCNAAGERLFGYSAAELIGRPVRMLIPADRQQEEDLILGRIRRGEPIEHFETVRVTKDRRLIDISLTVSPVRDGAGAIIGVSKVARDITERKRAAAELAAQQQWFRVTLDSIGDGVITCDAGGRVTFMNATAAKLTGWDAGSAVNQPCGEVVRLVRESTGQILECPVTRVLRTGGPVAPSNQTLLMAADDTGRPIDDNAAPIIDRDGNIIGVVLVLRDVTERRRNEAERQSAAMDRERLLESERIARGEAERASRVKDEFVAMVSHELRTPLNAILGWTQLMTSGRHDALLLARGLDVIARNTRVQAQLIADLLDISRIVSGRLRIEKQSVDLRALLDDAIEAVESDADAKGIELTKTVDDMTGPVLGDPARLQQIVWNLLSNAIKFTPSGGRIAVSLTHDASAAEISVRDTGVGIRPDVLPHVFDRFHQADRSITRRFGGLGLGLAIVKHLVEQHDGTVRAESREGEGSTFTIRFPITRELPGRPNEAQPAPPAAATVALASLRVLLVEDEPDTLEYLQRLLEDHGGIVFAAQSAAQALQILSRERLEIVISDIGLPEMDGYALIQQFRLNFDHGERIPAIALTAYARAEDRVRALEAGFDAHVAKPAEPSALLALVASLAKSKFGTGAKES